MTDPEYQPIQPKEKDPYREAARERETPEVESPELAVETESSREQLEQRAKEELSEDQKQRAVAEAGHIQRMPADDAKQSLPAKVQRLLLFAKKHGVLSAIKAAQETGDAALLDGLHDAIASGKNDKVS